MAKNGGTVKVIICFTDSLCFDDLKRGLRVEKKYVTEALSFSDEKDRISRLVSAFLKGKYVKKWEVDDFGKPQSPNVFFNVSHSGGAVTIALSDAAVGIDVEKIRPVNRSLYEYVLSDEELPLSEKSETFFKLWTAKESLVKAQGKGLIKNVKSIPALPFDGEKEYCGETYYSRQLKFGDYIVCVTRKGGPFNLDFCKEELT